MLHSYLGAVHHPQALTVYTHVQHPAHHAYDHTTKALALNGLGHLHGQQDHYPQATDHHEQALAICREIGYRAFEAHS